MLHAGMALQCLHPEWARHEDFLCCLVESATEMSISHQGVAFGDTGLAIQSLVPVWILQASTPDL